MNEKEDCIASLRRELNGTARWRERLAGRFSDDRNSKAVVAINRLSERLDEISDEDFAELRPHFNWASEKWLDAVSRTARQIGFAFPRPSVKFFLRVVINTLSKPPVQSAVA